jgi:hypothetical protein
VGGAFEQSGGTHIVRSTLSNIGTNFYFPSIYRLSGGTLMAPTIFLRGNNSIFAVSNSPTVSNSVFYFAGGIIQAEGSAQFGQLTIASNSVIAFGNGPGRISFLNSSVAAWESGAMLLISNWDGSVTGGGTHRVYFGNNSNGITAAQLAKTRFINPAGRLRGSYAPVVLGTGEIVLNPHNDVLVGGWAEVNASDPSSITYWDSQTIYPEPSTNVIAISAGNPNLALRADGTVLTWGNWGAPIPPESNHDLIAISAAPFHSLALRSDGTVLAWGYEYDTTRTNVPVGLSNVVAISAGTFVSLALRSDGSIVGWGDSTSNLTNIPPAAMPAIAVSVGLAHALALKADGTIFGWGQSDYGEAQPPPGLSNVVAIEAGNATSLALKSDGTVVAWGANYNGQTNVPPGLSNVVAISAGSSHALALKSDGTVVAWGNMNQSIPATVPQWLSNVRTISAGGDYSLVLLHGGPYIRAPISNSSEAGGQFSFSMPTRSGHVYGLEYVTDLANRDWQTVFPLVAGKAGMTTFTDTNGPPRFYRVREW